MKAAELFDLTGRRALITGSSQGIGFTIAQGLADYGAEVVLNGRDGGKRNADDHDLSQHLSNSGVTRPFAQSPTIRRSGQFTSAKSAGDCGLDYGLDCGVDYGGATARRRAPVRRTI